jgi:membrane protein
MLKFFKEVFNHFLSSNSFQKGAALAYYAVFSLIPMIIIITSLFGLFFGKQAVSGEIYIQLKDTLGSDASIQLQNIIKNQHTNHNNIFTSIIGFSILTFSATGMFSQIHNSFNDIWNIKEKPKSSLIKYFSKHFISFLILIGLFLIILISTAINSFLVKNAESLKINYEFSLICEHLISFVLLIVVFAIIFKFLGDAIIHWRVTILGGLFTALLFIFGKIGIGMYLGNSHISSTFGSASVLALLMLWVYYTSQIIFIGASFIKIISKKTGYEILPNKDAVKFKKIEVTN